MDNIILTCIIGFKNEGKEVENTLKSILATSSHTHVLLIDDNSDDNYDYKELMDRYDRCEYINTGKNLGVAGARDFGVAFCRTPYFILLDGHMRFYQQDWDLKVVKELESHPNSIISSTSVSMWLNNDGTIDNEDGKNGMIEDPYWGVTWTGLGKGCYINLKTPGHEFSSAWAARSKNEDDLLEVPSIMGAAYASSVEHWRYIKGLYMLRSYGNDEAFMAMKTWLLGGKCYILRKFGVGHLYRNSMPYNTYNGVDYEFNKLILAELFCDEETKNIKEFAFENCKKSIGDEYYKQLMQLFKDQEKEISEYKKYLNEHQTMTLKQFLDNVNSYATPLE